MFLKCDESNETARSRRALDGYLSWSMPESPPLSTNTNPSSHVLCRMNRSSLCSPMNSHHPKSIRIQFSNNRDASNKQITVNKMLSRILNLITNIQIFCTMQRASSALTKITENNHWMHMQPSVQYHQLTGRTAWNKRGEKLNCFLIYCISFAFYTPRNVLEHAEHSDGNSAVTIGWGSGLNVWQRIIYPHDTSAHHIAYALRLIFIITVIMGNLIKIMKDNKRARLRWNSIMDYCT